MTHSFIIHAMLQKLFNKGNLHSSVLESLTVKEQIYLSKM